MPTRSFRWLLLTLAVVSLGFDLGSKYGVFRWLYNGETAERSGAFESWTASKHWRDGHDIPVYGGRYNLVPGWFGFTAEYQDRSAKPSENNFVKSLQTWSADRMPHVNHGALFGLGSSHQDRANTIFAAVSLIAAFAILAWGLRKSNATDRWLCICLGLILGGTLGNLFDRIVFGGVRDFLYFYKVEWPVFNFADCCLVIGAVMLCVQAFFTPKKSVNPPLPISATVSVAAR